MQFQQDPNVARIVIRSYEEGRLLINNTHYSDNVIVTPDRVIDDKLPAGFSELDESHILYFCSLEPEVILLGTGERSLQSSYALKQVANNNGFAIDTMDTHAACRTFGVLASEGRKVIAALFV